MNTNTFAVIVGVVALVASIGAYVKPAQVVTQVEKQFGAVASPDIQSPYFSYGGQVFYASHPAMRSATTSLCSMQAPSSTSTLESASWQVTVGTSTSAAIDIGTSTDAFTIATTLVSGTSLGSSATGQAVWSSAGVAVQDSILAPNVWLNVKTQGAGLGGYTYGGTCSAVFKML